MQKMQEKWVRSLDQEDPLEEDMATCSRILAWETPWTEEPGGLLSMEVEKESDTTKHAHTKILHHLKLFGNRTSYPRLGQQPVN